MRLACWPCALWSTTSVSPFPRVLIVSLLPAHFCLLTGEGYFAVGQCNRGHWQWHQHRTQAAPVSRSFPSFCFFQLKKATAQPCCPCQSHRQVDWLSTIRHAQSVDRSRTHRMQIAAGRPLAYPPANVRHADLHICAVTSALTRNALTTQAIREVSAQAHKYSACAATKTLSYHA